MFTAWGVMGWCYQGRDIFWHGATGETWTTQPWMTTATGHSCRVPNRAFWVDWHPKTSIRRRRCRDAALAFFAPLIEGDDEEAAPPRPVQGVLAL